MKLNDKMNIVKLYDLADFQVGEDVNNQLPTEELENKESRNYNIHSRLKDVDFDIEKSYPGLNLINDTTISKKYRDYELLYEDENNVYLTPRYIINAEDDTVNFIFNDKSKMKYSNHFRNLQDKISNWFVGYINDVNFIKQVNSKEYCVNIDYIYEDYIGAENPHVLEILLRVVNNEELEFGKVPYTEYDVANEILKGRLEEENLTQDIMHKYMMNMNE